MLASPQIAHLAEYFVNAVWSDSVHDVADAVSGLPACARNALHRPLFVKMDTDSQQVARFHVTSLELTPRCS